jgi:hypothetical protein
MPVPHLCRVRTSLKKKSNQQFTSEDRLAKAIKRFKGLWFWQRWIRLGSFWDAQKELDDAVRFARMEANRFQTCPVRRKSLMRKIFHARQIEANLFRWNRLSY